MNKDKVFTNDLIFPISWLALMTVIIAVKIVPPPHADYFFMMYFGGFFVYFVFIKKEFNIKIFFSDMKTLVFWKYVIICILLLIVAYGLGTLPSIILPQHNIVFIETSFKRAYDLPSKIAFFFSAILFPALGQELFYRKAIIRFDTNSKIIISVVVGSVLFAINDNLDLYGIFRSFLVGLAFAFPYIKTRSINISIFAHYFVSIVTTIIF